MMRNDTAIRELPDAGLLHPDGAFAAGVNVMLDPWRDTEVVVRVRTMHAGRASSLAVHIGGGRALVQAGASTTDLVGGTLSGRPVVSAGHTQIDSVQTTGVPAVSASWRGWGQLAV